MKVFEWKAGKDSNPSGKSFSPYICIPSPGTLILRYLYLFLEQKPLGTSVEINLWTVEVREEWKMRKHFSPFLLRTRYFPLAVLTLGPPHFTSPGFIKLAVFCSGFLNSEKISAFVLSHGTLNQWAVSGREM